MFSFRKKVFGKQNGKIIFLLSGWPGKIWNYYLTVKILELNGFKSIVYEYDDSILSSSIKRTIENTTKVKEDILKQIEILKEKGAKDFSILGTSYGTLIAFMVTNQITSISKIIINLTGSDLAEIVWSWNTGKDSLVKKGIIKQNISLKSLKDKWQKLSPINNLNNLADKKILIYLAEKDEIIPFRLQSQLLNKLRQINQNIIVEVDKKHNHLLSAALNLLRYKKYIDDFLKRE
jgi:esterase/lipase